MVLEKLGSSLKGTLSKIAKSMFVDEKLVNELVKDIQRALLQSDVNVSIVLELSQKIKKRILSEDAPKGISKKEYAIKVVYEELVSFLGGSGHKITITEKPFKIMMIGLFGSGKTTTSAKLARFFKTRGNKVALLGLDIHRPAAMDQLMQVGKLADVPVFIEKDEKNARKIWEKYEKKLASYDIVIIDTAGRDALSEDLITEIEELTEVIQPQEKLLVISADIGQAARSQAEQFHKSALITGVIPTKMDGTARGGGALSACAVTKAPIKFIGVGEKVTDIEQFNPEGFVGRLLGMGDLEALLEKAREAISEEDAEDLGKRFLKGEFNLLDLYEQMTAMKKMGPLNKIVEMIPGFSQLKMPKEMLDVQEQKLSQWKFLMQSMTREELEDPEVIDRERIDRISQGSGTQPKDTRELVKQYKQSKKLMKMMKGKDPSKMMKKFQGMQNMKMR